MTLQEFFDVKESYRLPDKIMEMLLSPDAEKTITQIKEQTTINLQFSTLVNFILDWHDNEKDQRYIVEQIRMIDNEIEMIERQIDNEKQLKKWYLEKMMANDYP